MPDKEADGHIVIGISEKNGRAENIVGAAPVLADHDLHQFINSKTNRPVSFGVENIEHEGKPLTVIRIDKVQARPIFLRKHFAALKKHVVYIRHGSSTAEASPDEIKEMGREDQPARQADVTLIFEILLEQWHHKNDLVPMFPERVENVDLLSVTAINNGNALAQYIQGSLTIPRGFLFDYIDRTDVAKSVRDPTRTKAVTLNFSNQLRAPSPVFANPNPLEWRPLSPGMRLRLLREKFLPLGERLKNIDAAIQWELAVDSCPPRLGEQRLNEIPIINRR